MKSQEKSGEKTSVPAQTKITDKYPVPVVRALLFNDEGQLLILKRQGGAYCAGRWCLPGGKIDYGDTPEKAAIREIVEETGLRLVNPEFVTLQNSPPIAAGLMHCINLYYRGRAKGSLRLNEESSEFAWVTPQEAVRKRLVFGAGAVLKRLFGSGLPNQHR